VVGTAVTEESRDRKGVRENASQIIPQSKREKEKERNGQIVRLENQGSKIDSLLSI